MAINALIAAGVKPIGADLPEIGNMLQQKWQGDQRNALLQKQAQQQDMTFQQSQQDRQLETSLAQAQWASQPGLSKDQIAAQIPDIKSGFDKLHGAGSWDVASDADVQASAKEAVAKLSSQLRRGPPQTTTKNYLDADPTHNVYEIGPTGDRTLVQQGVPKAKDVTWGAPVSEVRGGKPARVQYDSQGNSRVVDGASPYEKPGAAAGSFSPDSVENTAQMMAGGQIAMLSGQALRTPWGQAVVSRVRELKPDYNASGFTTQAASLKDFTSGKSSQTTRSLNVGIAHLNTLANLSEALDNGNTPAFNKISNIWKQQTGQTAPNNFNSAKQIVAAEVVKAITGAGGGVSDREEAQHMVDAANSPQQLKEAIQNVRELFAGQLHGLRQTYEQGTGRKDFQRFLLPETVKEMSAFDDPGAGHSASQIIKHPSGATVEILAP